MAETPELAPCPRCDSEDVLCKEASDGSWVVCLDCNEHGELTLTGKDAVRLWNIQAKAARGPSLPLNHVTAQLKRIADSLERLAGGDVDNPASMPGIVSALQKIAENTYR